MVEVTISLMILCSGSHEGSLFYLWVFLEGFFPSGLVGHLLTILVTIPGRICCYGVVM
jgi:hypothetical protein